MSTVVEDNKRSVVLVINVCTQEKEFSIQHLKPQTTLTQNKYE